MKSFFQRKTEGNAQPKSTKSDAYKFWLPSSSKVPEETSSRRKPSKATVETVSGSHNRNNGERLRSSSREPKQGDSGHAPPIPSYVPSRPQAIASTSYTAQPTPIPVHSSLPQDHNMSRPSVADRGDSFSTRSKSKSSPAHPGVAGSIRTLRHDSTQKPVAYASSSSAYPRPPERRHTDDEYERRKVSEFGRRDGVDSEKERDRRRDKDSTRDRDKHKRRDVDRDKHKPRTVAVEYDRSQPSRDTGQSSRDREREERQREKDREREERHRTREIRAKQKDDEARMRERQEAIQDIRPREKEKLREHLSSRETRRREVDPERKQPRDIVREPLEEGSSSDSSRRKNIPTASVRHHRHPHVEPVPLNPPSIYRTNPDAKPLSVSAIIPPTTMQSDDIRNLPVYLPVRSLRTKDDPPSGSDNEKRRERERIQDPYALHHHDLKSRFQTQSSLTRPLTDVRARVDTFTGGKDRHAPGAAPLHTPNDDRSREPNSYQDGPSSSREFQDSSIRSKSHPPRTSSESRAQEITSTAVSTNSKPAYHTSVYPSRSSVSVPTRPYSSKPAASSTVPQTPQHSYSYPTISNSVTTGTSNNLSTQQSRPSGDNSRYRPPLAVPSNAPDLAGSSKASQTRYPKNDTPQQLRVQDHTNTATPLTSDNISNSRSGANTSPSKVAQLIAGYEGRQAPVISPVRPPSAAGWKSSPTSTLPVTASATTSRPAHSTEPPTNAESTTVFHGLPHPSSSVPYMSTLDSKNNKFYSPSKVDIASAVSANLGIVSQDTSSGRAGNATSIGNPYSRPHLNISTYSRETPVATIRGVTSPQSGHPDIQQIRDNMAYMNSASNYAHGKKEQVPLPIPPPDNRPSRVTGPKNENSKPSPEQRTMYQHPKLAELLTDVQSVYANAPQVANTSTDSALGLASRPEPVATPVSTEFERNHNRRQGSHHAQKQSPPSPSSQSKQYFPALVQHHSDPSSSTLNSSPQSRKTATSHPFYPTPTSAQPSSSLVTNSYNPNPQRPDTVAKNVEPSKQAKPSEHNLPPPGTLNRSYDTQALQANTNLPPHYIQNGHASSHLQSDESILMTPSSLAPTMAPIQPTTSRSSIPASVSSREPDNNKPTGFLNMFRSSRRAQNNEQGSSHLPMSLSDERASRENRNDNDILGLNNDHRSRGKRPPDITVPVVIHNGVDRDRKSPNSKVFTPFRYLTGSRRHRTVSAASAEAVDGFTTAANTVGSPTASMHSQPMQPPPLRDPYEATQEWREYGNKVMLSRQGPGGRVKIHRPGVVFDVQHDPFEDKHTQRPLRPRNRKNSSPSSSQDQHINITNDLSD